MNNDKTNEKLTDGKSKNNRRRPYYNKKKHRKGNGSPDHNNAAPEVTDNSIKANIADEGEEASLSSIAFEDDMTPSVTVSIETDSDVKKIFVTGVRFKPNGKVYYFNKGELTVKEGSYVIVDTARGLEFGEVAFTDLEVKESSIVLPLRDIVRVATDKDVEHNAANKQKEEEAFRICLEKIANHSLDMKLIEAQYSFDNSKLLFYFTSASRVDFRELVKDLASVFKTRIELRQIGIRDEAKIMGGLGACGRPLCCSTFLSDFVQVSIKMAKEQNLSLNSGKISGCCGRLMCCLQYEYKTYAEETAKTPPVDSVVKTRDGIGTVTEINALAGTVKVKLKDKPDMAPILFKRDDVSIISRPTASKDQND
jgi:cell fate regulator YaaT (PSP1 superfamily)